MVSCRYRINCLKNLTQLRLAGVMLIHAGKETCMQDLKNSYFLGLTEPDDKMKPDKVVIAFREYYHLHKNIIYVWHKF